MLVLCLCIVSSLCICITSMPVSSQNSLSLYNLLIPRYFSCKMVKYFNNDRSPNKKFRMQKPGGIQKRSFGGRSGGGRDGFTGFAKKTKYALSTEDLMIPDWNSVTLKPFKKDFYVPHENVERR